MYLTISTYFITYGCYVILETAVMAGNIAIAPTYNLKPSTCSTRGLFKVPADVTSTTLATGIWLLGSGEPRVGQWSYKVIHT